MWAACYPSSWSAQHHTGKPQGAARAIYQPIGVCSACWLSRQAPLSCSRASVRAAAAFEDDPNSPEQEASTSGTAPAKRQAQRRPGQSTSKSGSAAAGRNAEDKSSKQKNTKLSPEKLKAMGYDDVDDFVDDERPSERLQLREDDPLYVPALTDEDLAEDPPDHKSGYVAVIGKPNAGKSTLINSIVGQKLSIVSRKPQTTRHRIMGIASDKDYQMILFDTPGIIEHKRTKLEERMMSAVVTSIQNSEAIIAVVDASDQPKEALAMFQPGSNWSGPPMAVLLNKADSIAPEAMQELVAWYKEACRAEAVFSGSALQGGDGIKDLKAWAVSKLPLGPTLYSKKIVSEQPERFFVAELIREKIFLQYDQEIPYSVQVNITEFKERAPPAKVYISAQIMVERESQVGIIIGKGGIAIKKLGEAARKDIESFLERGVFLELGVTLSERWRENKDALEKFGYFDPMLV